MIYERRTIPAEALEVISETEKESFVLTTRDGRESLSDRILKDVDRFCEVAYDDGFRSHLGASLIAHSCSRYLWFVFRWMVREKFSGRMQRLFNRGHREEERFIEWLEGIGFKIYQTDPETGKQFKISDVEGHFGGSCDGVALLPARYGSIHRLLLEFKTSGTGSKFNELKNNGVNVAKPEHFGQQCVYGLKLDLTHALYMSINKNDDDIHNEVIELDHSLGSGLIERARTIITTAEPPKRLSENPSYYECKWCPAQGVCHLGKETNRNCRSCQFASPATDAQWFCSKWNANIPKEHIANGCDAWTVLPH